MMNSRKLQQILQNSKASHLGAGCFILFGIPFFLPGVFVLITLLYQMNEVRSSRSWVPIEATWTESLDDNAPLSKRSETHAYPYEYVWDGVTYRSENAPHTMLIKVNQSRRPLVPTFKPIKGNVVTCYVNPRNPGQSTLILPRWHSEYYLMSIFVFSHGILGFLMISSAFRNIRSKRARYVEAPHDKPWLSRKDWSKGFVEAEKSSGFFYLSSITFVWITLYPPAAWLVFTDPNPVSSSMFWGTLFLAGMSFFLLYLTYKCYLASHFSKQYRLLLDRNPLQTGAPLQVTLQRLQKDFNPRILEAKLVCTESVYRGKSKQKNILYHTNLLIDTQSSAFISGEMSLANDLEIPLQFPMSKENSFNHPEIQWQLQLSQQGFLENTSFTLPVFEKATSTVSLSENATSSDSPSVPIILPNLKDLRHALQSEGILCHDISEEMLDLTFPPNRMPTLGKVFRAITFLAWPALGYLLYHQLWIESLGCGICLFVFKKIADHVQYGTTQLTVTPEGVRNEFRLFQKYQVKELSASTIKRIFTSLYSKSNKQNSWSIYVQTSLQRFPIRLGSFFRNDLTAQDTAHLIAKILNLSANQIGSQWSPIDHPYHDGSGHSGDDRDGGD